MGEIKGKKGESGQVETRFLLFFADSPARSARIDPERPPALTGFVGGLASFPAGGTTLNHRSCRQV